MKSLSALVIILILPAQATPPSRPSCRQVSLEGELEAGRPSSQPIGNGLRLYFQPIVSGWIIRVLPLAGPLPAHDFAELATPPYQSVTPLSLSTDFSFRAQDAVGWNPRRFRFSTSPAAAQPLAAAYMAYQQSFPNVPGPVQARLAEQVALAAEATLTILDARLTPGTADQWSVAAGVSAHFLTTAHTLVPPPDGRSSALGRLLWLRYRLSFDLPANYIPAPGLKMMPHVCGTS